MKDSDRILAIHIIEAMECVCNEDSFSVYTCNRCAKLEELNHE